MSFVKCHPCTSETLNTILVPAQRVHTAGCVQGSLTSWAGIVCVGKARGGAVHQPVAALLNHACACVWTLSRLYSITRWEKQFMRFKWDFLKGGMSWCSWGDQWEFGRRAYKQILFLKWINKSCRTKHSWILTIIFLLNPHISYVRPFLFWSLLFLKKHTALEKQ